MSSSMVVVVNREKVRVGWREVKKSASGTGRIHRNGNY